jgi:cytochrome c oxidase assembly protein subunit 15
LGALTVTQLLRFDVVTAHLATALALVALLSVIHQGLLQLDRNVQSPDPPTTNTPTIQAPAPLALLARHGWWLASAITALAVVIQAVSGALMASQWASGTCVASGVGCGWLALHRQLATPVAAVVLTIAVAHLLTPSRRRRQAFFALAALGLVLLQIALGVLTLRLSLAVPLLTVGHQITAALLVAVLSALAMRNRPPVAVASFAAAGVPQSNRFETCHG